ncbi:MAG: hypothetical protein Q9P01_18710 [Anaerolineae bacterium]|nr:hypothetical protein [Anaerolineae bacterium]MDQ7036786.1 hypothetical protein [Anaerolineae bacterium]
MLKRLSLLILALLSLAACSSSQTQLPLAEGKPTLIFFYTEN